MESGVDHPGRHAISLSKSSDGEMPVIGNLGSNIDDESLIADSSFAVKDLLVDSRFTLFHFTNDLLQLCFLQGLVSIDLFHHFFNLL
jgi:hypothetical protein